MSNLTEGQRFNLARAFEVLSRAAEQPHGVHHQQGAPVAGFPAYVHVSLLAHEVDEAAALVAVMDDVTEESAERAGQPYTRGRRFWRGRILAWQIGVTGYIAPDDDEPAAGAVDTSPATAAAEQPAGPVSSWPATAEPAGPCCPNHDTAPGGSHVCTPSGDMLPPPSPLSWSVVGRAAVTAEPGTPLVFPPATTDRALTDHDPTLPEQEADRLASAHRAGESWRQTIPRQGGRLVVLADVRAARQAVDAGAEVTR